MKWEHCLDNLGGPIDLETSQGIPARYPLRLNDPLRAFPGANAIQESALLTAPEITSIPSSSSPCMNIPFLDLHAAYRELKPVLGKAIRS